jgi:hypothetical protein
MPFVLPLIFSENRSLQTSIKMIIQKADGDDSRKNRMVPRLASDWVAAFGPVPMNTLLNNLLERLQLSPRHLLRQLHVNVEYLLLGGEGTSSEKSDCTEFDDYILLMFRYDPRQCFATTV